MKKKIITSFFGIGIFIVVIAVIFLMIYLSPWAKEKNERSAGWSECGFILKANEDKGDFLIVEKKGYDFFEYCINCAELDGAITFKVCYLPDFDIEESTHNDRKASVIMQEKIEKPGIYEYNFSDLKDGVYKFELIKKDNMVSASGSIRVTTYYNNWSRLMTRLGLK